MPPAVIEPLERETLLIHCEQGLGDTIQFIRYVAIAKQRVRRMALRCPAGLKALLRRVEGVDELIGEDEPPPAYARQVPLLSLPGIVGTTLACVPSRTPYLSADPVLIDRWRERLKALWPPLPAGGWSEPSATRLGRGPASLRVGVNWQGNAHYQGDCQRSFSPECFAPLRSVPGVALVSLQKGIGAPQFDVLCKSLTGCDRSFLAHLGGGVDEAHGAFMDTAAVMMNLDLVVTSDTAVAHLAGALGRPVWVALPHSADWRWLSERSDSPWYPTMRLYRQPSRGNWSAVFERITRDLRRVCCEGQALLASLGA